MRRRRAWLLIAAGGAFAVASLASSKADVLPICAAATAVYATLVVALRVVPRRLRRRPAHVTERLALVGPAHPDTGGISHFTAGLAPVLNATGGVTVLTWSRRYPARLYPGTLRDTVSTTAIAYDGAVPMLDILNPLTWRAAVARARRDACATLVLQWVHPVQGPVYRTMALAARRAGMGVVGICHNVSPHESSLLWSRMVRLGLRSADVLVVHSRPMAEEARRLHPRRAGGGGLHADIHERGRGRRRPRRRDRRRRG